MASQEKETDDYNCSVCYVRPQIFAVGECNHITCYKCAIRIRVLSGQRECPICRQEIKVLILSENIKPFNIYRRQHYTTNVDYNIEFENNTVKEEFDSLFIIKCKICKQKTFQSANELNEHMMKVHSYAFCKLCMHNLHMFIEEWKLYTMSALEEHYRNGDPDDKSFKGHPLCEYCMIRFYDKDDFRLHIKSSHYICSFCEPTLKYYNTYACLQNHYIEEHYFCSDTNCSRDNVFISVFKTKAQLNEHNLSVHGANEPLFLNTRSTQIELGFRLPPRPNRVNQDGAREDTSRWRYTDDGTFVDYGESGATVNDNELYNRLLRGLKYTSLEMNNSEEFPSLEGGENSASVSTRQTPSGSIQNTTTRLELGALGSNGSSNLGAIRKVRPQNSNNLLTTQSQTFQELGSSLSGNSGLMVTISRVCEFTQLDNQLSQPSNSSMASDEGSWVPLVRERFSDEEKPKKKRKNKKSRVNRSDTNK